VESESTVVEEYNPWWISKERIIQVETFWKYEESEVWIPSSTGPSLPGL
jgi:hypothetical protein